MLSLQVIRPRVHHVTAYAARRTHSYELKYADKLRQKARETGLDLEKLRAQAREEARRERKKEADALLASLEKTDTKLLLAKTRSDRLEGAKTSSARKDSSPVKASVQTQRGSCAAALNLYTTRQPLSSILHLSKLIATPHTSSQISTLWTAYHASRTKNTGRGYICATLPLESYNAMTGVAKKYPAFVVPVPRKSTPGPSASESNGTAHEFFFLQWSFHPAPPAPSVAESNPFEPAMSRSSCHIPEPSTVLFTPLQEYKLRTSFATPYLVLTFYTDLSQSHGIVLLRGEITPSSTSAGAQPGPEISERFLLSQVDAQLLAMGLQRFYLWGDLGKDRNRNLAAEALLKQFHEEPEQFSWQDLLKSSDVVA